MAAGGHPFGDTEYGEYPESEPEVEDPEVDLGKGEEQGWQLPVSSRGRRDEDLLLPRPEPQFEAPLPDLPEELPELNLQLELFPEQPLPPELPGGEEQRSGDLPRLHDRELLALQDGKEREEEGRGRKRKRSKERRRREKEEKKRRKERKRSKGRRGRRLPSCNARQLFIFMFSVILCDGIAHGEFHVHLDFEHGSFGLECELLKINFFRFLSAP